MTRPLLWKTISLTGLMFLLLSGCPKDPETERKVATSASKLTTLSWEPTCADGKPGLIWAGTAEGGETVTDCFHATTNRPVSALSDCPGADKDGALCYPYCKEGYDGVGPVCWQNCPPGYRDDGASCFKDAKIISADVSNCPWWNKCGLGRDCSKCPEGYSNDGCTCRRDPDLIWKDAYGRGAGKPMSCAPGKQRIGALCYDDCPAGYKPGGAWGDIECSADEETCREIPKQEPVTPESGQWCFKVFRQGTSFVTYDCNIYQINGPEEQAEKAAQLCCENCTVEKIECGDWDACEYTPPMEDPEPEPTPPQSPDPTDG